MKPFEYSVVIPAYNAAGFIERTINSILSQTLPAREILVIDDGSTDDTAKIVCGYGPPVRYIYQENAGDGPARNTGISQAKSDWVAFIDHDDEWLAKKMELHAELLSRNPELKWCASNYIRKSAESKQVAENIQNIGRLLKKNEYFGDFFTAMLYMKYSFMSSTIVVHKSAFEQAGLFDSCWLRCADQDMWWRIGYIYPKIGYIKDPLAILHLAAQDEVSTRLRLQTKRGMDARKLISKHLELAKKYGRTETFEPYAKKYIISRFWVTVYHGFKQDSLAFLETFTDFFPQPKRFLIRLLLVFPGLTSFCLKSAAKFMRFLKLEKNISRRWITAGRQ